FDRVPGTRTLTGRSASLLKILFRNLEVTMKPQSMARMFGPAAVGFALIGAFWAGCGGDDSSTAMSGTAGSSGHGGAAGRSGGGAGGAATGGAGGAATGGSGGAATG